MAIIITEKLPSLSDLIRKVSRIGIKKDYYLVKCGKKKKIIDAATREYKIRKRAAFKSLIKKLHFYN